MFRAQHQSPRKKVDQTILLIEDDRMVSSLIKSYLEKDGYQVHPCYRGDAAYEHMTKSKPALIVLDIGLPGLDGFQVCQRLREGFQGPIMMLTAQAHDKEQVTAFNLGADDYLVKPVSPSVLKVRIQGLLRRQPAQNVEQLPSVFQVGDLSVYPNANKCHVQGKRIKLSTFEFQLITFLIRNVGRVMTRDSIYSSLLGRQYNGSERTVDVRISRLRDKLIRQGMERAIIETVWGKGYILNELSR